MMMMIIVLLYDICSFGVPHTPMQFSDDNTKDDDDKVRVFS